MYTGLYKLASGMMVELRRQENATNNMVGSRLPGYRREIVTATAFSDKLLEQTNDPNRPYIPGGTSITVDQSPGPIRQTGRSLDFALRGDGFFVVEDGNGDLMVTRNGAFELAPDGTLITHEGYALRSRIGQIKLNIKEGLHALNVRPDGTLVVENDDGSQRTQDRLLIAKVTKDDNVERLTGNYYTLRLQGRDPVAAEDVTVMNRTLEQSNVVAVEEMVSMMDSVRQFESAQRVMRMMDEVAGRHARLLFAG